MHHTCTELICELKSSRQWFCTLLWLRRSAWVSPPAQTLGQAVLVIIAGYICSPPFPWHIQTHWPVCVSLLDLQRSHPHSPPNLWVWIQAIWTWIQYLKQELISAHLRRLESKQCLTGGVHDCFLQLMAWKSPWVTAFLVWLQESLAKAAKEQDLGLLSPEAITVNLTITFPSGNLGEKGHLFSVWSGKSLFRLIKVGKDL